MTSSTIAAAAADAGAPAAGLARLLASRRARAHEAAAVDEGTTARPVGGALALATAAAKRSRPTKSRREITAAAAPPSPLPKATTHQELPHADAARPMVATRERGVQTGARVTPRLRWQCQHFLLANLRRARLSRDAIDPWADAEACHARPMGCADVDVVYCRTAEEAVYAEADGRPVAYEACLRRIAYALRSGGRVIMANHPADTLATLDNDVLSACTAPGRRRLRERARLDECRTMMSDAGVFEDAAAAVVRCRRCGGSDITTSLLQTRGADEPMTVFSQCANPKCGARWRQ